MLPFCHMMKDVKFTVLLLVTEARYPRANFSVQVWQLPLKCFPDIIVTP